MSGYMWEIANLSLRAQRSIPTSHCLANTEIVWHFVPGNESDKRLAVISRFSFSPISFQVLSCSLAF